MKVIFTKHARDRMEERRISEFLVLASIESADSLNEYRDGWRLSKVLPDGRTLVIGFAKDGLSMIVTTVFIKEKV